MAKKASTNESNVPLGLYLSTTCHDTFILTKQGDELTLEYVTSPIKKGKIPISYAQARQQISLGFWVKQP